MFELKSTVAALFRKQIRLRGVFRTLSNIYEEWFFCEIFLLKVVNYFCKKIHMWCFARFGTFVQFKKREKHPWRSVIFSKVAGFLLKVTLLYVCFSRFFNCKWYQIAQRITICLTWSWRLWPEKCPVSLITSGIILMQILYCNSITKSLNV